MQIQQLVYFMKIAELGSMNKAAAELMMTQPNLSRAVMNLEGELNIKIFKRNNKGVILTEDGKRLYQYTRTILNQMELIEGIASREATPTLSIASYPTVSISRLASEIYNQHKGENIKIQLLERRLQRVIETVESGEAELGFLIYNSAQNKDVKHMLQYKNIEHNYLGADTWYANVGPHSPLYDRDEVEAEELLHYPVVRMPDDYFSNLTFYLTVGGVLLTEFKKVVYMSDNGAAINMLRYTDVFRFGSRINSEDYALHGIRTIPIRNCGVEISLAWIRRKKEILSPVAEEFARMLEGWVSGVLG